MTVKLLALGLVVLAGLSATGLRAFALQRDQAAQEAATAAIVLLPATLDGAAASRSWDNHFSSGVIEQGAVYGQPGATKLPVQLDFFRRRSDEHNGIFCYIVQGEAMQWHAFRQVRTRGGLAQFEIAITDASGQMRLTAATECRKDGCTEKERAPGLNVDSIAAAWRGDADAVVPMSIGIEYPYTAGSYDPPAMQRALLQRFDEVVGEVDLEPAQQLAAAMDGR